MNEEKIDLNAENKTLKNKLKAIEEEKKLRQENKKLENQIKQETKKFNILSYIGDTILKIGKFSFESAIKYGKAQEKKINKESKKRSKK